MIFSTAPYNGFCGIPAAPAVHVGEVMTTGTKGQTRPVCTRTGDDSSDITRAACLTPRDGSEDNPQLLRMRGNIKYRTDGVDSTPSYARHLVWLLAPDNGNQQHGRNKSSGDQSPFNQRRAQGCLGPLSYSSAGNRGCGSGMIPNSRCY